MDSDGSRKRALELTRQAWTIFLVEIVSFAVMLVLFIAPGWGWTQEIWVNVDQADGEMYGYYGMWYVCHRLVGLDGRPTGHQSCALLADYNVPSWMKGCQAMMVLAFFCAAASLALSAVYVCVKSFNKSHATVIGIGLTAIVTVGLMIIAFVLFCVLFLHDAKWCCSSGRVQIVHWHLWYCFIMACAMPAFYGAIAITSVVEFKKLRRQERKWHDHQQHMMQLAEEERHYQQMMDQDRKWKQQYRPHY